MGGDSIDPVHRRGLRVRRARLRRARGACRDGQRRDDDGRRHRAKAGTVQRWELDDEYLRRGYVVNTHTTSVSPVPNGASETLEYALDDFSIARLAYALRDRRTYDAVHAPLVELDDALR